VVNLAPLATCWLPVVGTTVGRTMRVNDAADRR
jgi:hypothetical protein